MTRKLWSKGIHVGHPNIDGAIDTEFIRSNFPDRYRVKDQQGIVNPDSMLKRIGKSTSNHAMPGRMKQSCGLGWKAGKPSVIFKK